MPASEVDSPPEDTRDLVFKFLENKLCIENPRGRIEFQRVHRLGKPDNSSDKPRPIMYAFLPAFLRFVQNVWKANAGIFSLSTLHA